MRTTVDLDEDILRTAKDLARESGSSLGRAISDLVRRGLEPPPREASFRGDGIPVFPRLPGAKPVTSEIVKELLESED
jgi:hypothetical protein